MVFISIRKVAGALQSPLGIPRHSSYPPRVLNAVFSSLQSVLEIDESQFSNPIWKRIEPYQFCQKFHRNAAAECCFFL